MASVLTLCHEFNVDVPTAPGKTFNEFSITTIQPKKTMLQDDFTTDEKCMLELLDKEILLNYGVMLRLVDIKSEYGMKSIPCLPTGALKNKNYCLSDPVWGLFSGVLDPHILAVTEDLTAGM